MTHKGVKIQIIYPKDDEYRTKHMNTWASEYADDNGAESDALRMGTITRRNNEVQWISDDPKGQVLNLSQTDFILIRSGESYSFGTLGSFNADALPMKAMINIVAYFYG